MIKNDTDGDVEKLRYAVRENLTSEACTYV